MKEENEETEQPLQPDSAMARLCAVASLLAQIAPCTPRGLSAC